jgi:hypothetical protein
MKMLILIALTLNLSTSALAQSRTAFILYDDGGEHVPASCLKVNKVPRGLIKSPQLKMPEYLGSQQIEFSDKNEAGIDSFHHYFSSKKACEKVRKKMLEFYDA